MTKKKGKIDKWLVLVALAALSLFASGFIMAQGPASNDKVTLASPFQVKDDGTVVMGDRVFKSADTFFRSAYFQSMVKRCGTSENRVGKRATPPLASQAHCTTSLTVIRNEYYPSEVHTIPIVFHVIYHSNGTGNLTDQQINDQMEVLNEDFRAKTGTMGANGFDSMIQFTLAEITRTQNNSWFNDQGNYQSSLARDTQKYLNVYSNTASGNLGYATLPQEDAGASYDGVVMLYNTIGGRNNGYDTFDQGRTLVHEIGHYLGLEHTFHGDGCFDGYAAGDLIADTNSESQEGSGCTQTYSCGTADPIHNYMNYTDDTCMTEFTQEQANRMICSLVNYRPNLYTTSTEGGGGNSGGTGDATISLSRSTLYFAAVSGGSSSKAQTVLIDNSGSGTLNWSTSITGSWLSRTPSSGSGAGSVSVSVNGGGLAAGNYSGKISFTDPDATNSPQDVTVNLTVIPWSQETVPFGTLATPLDGQTYRGSVPVTGWALDDVGIESVKIYNGSNYVGDAVMVEGSRPDVQSSYPFYPGNSSAGFGYMMLTHFLPGGGNGWYTISAMATDTSGNTVTLGSKTIFIDNDNAVKPFGAIDTPTQGGAASGSSFINWGWVLTPQPNTIPTDGSTIRVWVDGVNKGNPAYNIYRSDIATLFPGYNNSDGAVGYLYLDTTAYSNGVHTIQWTATDDDGNSDGIGSRYFTIQNSGSRSATSRAKQTGGIKIDSIPGLDGLKTDLSPITVKTGYGKNAPQKAISADRKGVSTMEIRELQRIKVQFSGPVRNISKLPIGSTIDSEAGAFYWQTGPGFLGTYTLTFLTGENQLKTLKITISPR